MAFTIERYLVVAAICAASFLTLSGTDARAGDRAHRVSCMKRLERLKSEARFDVPRTYRSVTEPGGMVQRLNPDGTPWHAAPGDVRRMAARIETTPTDNLEVLPITSMHQVEVKGGRVYSRIECAGLDCLFKVAFVPTIGSSIAVECGVEPLYLRIVGVTGQGLAAAQRAIRFRWNATSAISLADLTAR